MTTPDQAAPLLELRGVNITYGLGRGDVYAVRGVDLTVDSGEALGIAGESGSGKSTLAMSLMRLLPSNATLSGEVLLRGENVVTASWGRVRTLRWAEASIVFQGAMTALNPVRTIGQQICEPILLHEKVGLGVAQRRTRELLDSVGVPAARMSAYPHELSGGQRQRVMIAMALACNPELIIADEPTTALDVMVQAQILELLRELAASNSIGLIMISHDLSVLSEICDRIAVMYAGTVCEVGPSKQVLENPTHPYTAALLRAFPVIGDPASRRAPHGLPGDPPSPEGAHEGCPFAPRCPVVMDVCSTRHVELWPSGPASESSCLRVLPEFQSLASVS